MRDLIVFAIVAAVFYYVFYYQEQMKEQEKIERFEKEESDDFFSKEGFDREESDDYFGTKEGFENIEKYRYAPGRNYEKGPNRPISWDGAGNCMVREHFEKEESDDFFSKEGFDNPQFIMYYADWCGHCKTSKPEFQKLMKTHNGKGVKISMVNSDQEPEKIKAAGVQGFPTFHLVKNGQPQKYEGGRTHSDFANFLQNNL